MPLAKIFESLADALKCVTGKPARRKRQEETPCTKTPEV